MPEPRGQSLSLSLSLSMPVRVCVPDRRPRTDDLTFGKISNGHISAADHPIYSVFGSRMGFSGSADRMALIPV